MPLCKTFFDLNCSQSKFHIKILMKISRVVLLVTAVLLVSAAYWIFTASFLFSKAVKEEKFIRCITALSSKYQQFVYSDYRRNEDNGEISYQSLYDVKNYDLKLSFDIPSKYLYGTLEMNSASISDTLRKIYINLSQDMKVLSVRLNDNQADFIHKDNFLIISVNGSIRNNEEFKAEVKYEGSPKNYGFDSFSFKTFSGDAAIYTLSEPEYASTWWPCKDIPSDKFTIDISITVPSQLTAVSNGLLKEVRDEENGEKTFVWKSSYPIATYLVSLAIGKYDKWTDTYYSKDSLQKMPVEYYSYPEYTENAKADWKNTVRMIGFFSDKFGEYPFIKEKYGMAMFGWVGGAMEHQTISSMGYTLVKGNGQYEYISVHELAHQWFGDAVTPESWKDIWLNEGFASYSEALWIENEKGTEAYRKYLKNEDYGFFQGTVYNPEGFIFGPTVYNKGAWCLHMLRGTVGDSVFFEILRKYYDRYKYKNANTYDFQKICEEVSGTDLKYFFDQWIFTGTGRPDYRYSWKADDFQDQTGTGIYTLRIKLRQVQEDSSGVYKMPVRFTVITDNGSQEIKFFNDMKVQQFEHPVRGKPVEVLIDNENWILKKSQIEEYKDTY